MSTLDSMSKQTAFAPKLVAHKHLDDKRTTPVSLWLKALRWQLSFGLQFHLLLLLLVSFADFKEFDPMLERNLLRSNLSEQTVLQVYREFFPVQGRDSHHIVNHLFG